MVCCRLSQGRDEPNIRLLRPEADEQTRGVSNHSHRAYDTHRDAVLAFEAAVARGLAFSCGDALRGPITYTTCEFLTTEDYYICKHFLNDPTSVQIAGSGSRYFYVVFVGIQPGIYRN